MKSRYWLLAFGFLLAAGSAVAAQDTARVPAGDSVMVDNADASPFSSVRPPPRRWLAGAWAGAAFNSGFATRQGRRHRDLYMAGLRFVSADARTGDFALDYYVEVVPLIRTTNTPVEYRAQPCPPGPQPLACGEYEMITETVSGYGLTPLGLQLRAFARARMQLTMSVGLGLARYQRPVPDPGEKRLNFMGDVGVGIQVRLGRAAVLTGIRHNHTSNAGTGSVNPGLDSRVVYVAFTRPFRQRAKR